MIRVIFTALLLLVTTCAKATEKPVVLVLLVEYPPYLSQQMEGGGILFGYLDSVLQHEDWQVRYLYQPVARVVKDIEGHNWLIATYNKVSAEHHELLTLEKDVPGVILVRRREKTPFLIKEEIIDSKAQLAWLNGMDDLGLLKEAGLDEVERVNVNSIDQGMKMLVNNRVDYLLCFVDACDYSLKQAGIDKSLVQYSDTVRKFPFHLLLNKNHPLADRIREYLKPKLIKPDS